MFRREYRVALRHPRGFTPENVRKRLEWPSVHPGVTIARVNMCRKTGNSRFTVALLTVFKRVTRYSRTFARSTLQRLRQHSRDFEFRKIPQPFAIRPVPFAPYGVFAGDFQGTLIGRLAVPKILRGAACPVTRAGIDDARSARYEGVRGKPKVARICCLCEQSCDAAPGTTARFLRRGPLDGENSGNRCT